MFDSYCRVTPNADQTLLVEYYELISDYKSEHVSIFNSNNIYKHFVYCGAEVYEIQGNTKAWQLFYNRFITEMKGKDSFLTEDFSLERIKEEYSTSEAICKKEGLEYDPVEDSQYLWDAIFEGEIAECEVDECADDWNNARRRW